MFIKLTAARAVELHERDNFRAFKVVIEGSRDALDEVRRALTGTAELVDAETAWVSEQALRHRNEVAQDAGWQSAFDAMIEKARPHGWIDDDRKAIKAHIAWTR